MVYSYPRLKSDNDLKYLFCKRIVKICNKGLPEYIRSGNGSEFTARKVRKFISNLGTLPAFIELDSPWENSYIELLKGKVIGVLNTYTSELHIFSENEINILKTVADQAAIVIENYRLVIETKVIKEELETRKILEKAKGIIMEEQKMSEEEAFKKIQKFAMNSRKSIREVADAVILSHEMKKI